MRGHFFYSKCAIAYLFIIMYDYYLHLTEADDANPLHIATNNAYSGPTPATNAFTIDSNKY